jgi:hypothetical protein
MPQELSSTERLLQRNLQQFNKTGEVLETEFKVDPRAASFTSNLVFTDGGAR